MLSILLRVYSLRVVDSALVGREMIEAERSLPAPVQAQVATRREGSRALLQVLVKLMVCSEACKKVCRIIEPYLPVMVVCSADSFVHFRRDPSMLSPPMI